MLTTVFFGNPQTAVPFLKHLAEKTRVLGVVTSPDEPAGRGHKSKEPPVKSEARALGLPVAQSTALKSAAALRELQKGGRPDVGLAVAYGKLLPPEILSWPRRGVLNVHFSLLPKYRGAAPVQWALMRGEKETGVTIFQLVEELDAGPVYLQKPLPILPEDTSATLRARLAGLGLALLSEALPRFEAGDWTPEPQVGEPTRAPALGKDDGRILWNLWTARDVVNRIRGTWEWPGAYAFVKGRRLNVRWAEERAGGEGRPGTIIGFERGRGFLVKCSVDAALVARVKPEGKAEMNGDEFWNGARLKIGDSFDL